jgi:hypothetical protein
MHNQYFVGCLVGGKDLGFDVELRGQIRNHIMPGTYVFFQRLKEHGG